MDISEGHHPATSLPLDPRNVRPKIAMCKTHLPHSKAPIISAITASTQNPKSDLSPFSESQISSSE